MSLHVVETLDLLAAHLGVVDFENVDGVFVVKTVFVDTHNGLTTRVDAGLGTGRSLFDTELRKTCLDSLSHTAELLDFLDVCPCAVCDFVGEGFHIVRASPGVDSTGYLSLFLDVNLSVTCDTCREVGRQCYSLVESVGVETLSVAESGAHSFDASTAYVVEGVLLGERPARGLRVCTQGERFGVLGVELLHNLGPEHTRGTHLGYFHEIVHADSPEERQARSERVDIHAGVHTCAEVFETVGEGVGKLDVAGSAGFLHVIARNRDRVELRHVLRGILEDVGDNTHRELRRVDIGVAHHKLLEDIVLNGTGHFLELGTLLKTCVDVEGKHGEHSAVHGHRHRHLVQRYTVEEHLHVVERANRHTCLAHVAHHAFVVGIVAAVCGEVERYRQTLLARREVAAVEGIRLGSCREACILADGPRAKRIHRAVRAAEIRRNTRHVVQVFESFEVSLGVYGFYGDKLGGGPVFHMALSGLGAACPCRNVYSLKIRFHIE